MCVMVVLRLTEGEGEEDAVEEREGRQARRRLVRMLSPAETPRALARVCEIGEEGGDIRLGLVECEGEKKHGV